MQRARLVQRAQYFQIGEGEGYIYHQSAIALYQGSLCQLAMYQPHDAAGSPCNTNVL